MHAYPFNAYKQALPRAVNVVVIVGGDEAM
jgi:hypothetical protein